VYLFVDWETHYCYVLKQVVLLHK